MVSRFYSSSINEIESMPVDKFNKYHQAMIKIGALDYIKELNLMDYPNMKSADRSKLYKSISEKAHPREDKKFKSTKELMGFLNG